MEILQRHASPLAFCWTSAFQTLAQAFWTPLEDKPCKPSSPPSVAYHECVPHEAVQKVKTTYERFQNHAVELKYAENVAPCIRKAFATYCEMIFASLFAEQDVSASERKTRITAQLKKLNAMEPEWGDMQSLMHPRLLKEAASLTFAP